MINKTSFRKETFEYKNTGSLINLTVVLHDGEFSHGVLRGEKHGIIDFSNSVELATACRLLAEALADHGL